MIKRIYLLVLIFISSISLAQLLPDIGLYSKPNDNTAICNEPFYLGNYYNSGYQLGNSVPDFKLYALNGDSIILSEELSAGKPVLLISGSLTCPVFRAKAAIINQVAATYSALIKVYIIYTIEAHPTDTSVYFGYVNVTSQNTNANILFPEPQTYGARKQMVDTLPYYSSLNPEVFIDGPCNNWWKNYGPAPNNSYLIGTNGKVLNKHGWFHKNPDNIFCDLDSILNFNSGLCVQAPTAPGTFTINPLNTSVNGNPEDLLYDHINVINTSSVSTFIKIKKLQKLLPSGWQTAFCADVCYGTQDDSIEVSIDPFDTLKFSLDFFTGAIPDSASVRIGFKNINKANNAFSLWLRASTLPVEVSIKTNFQQENYFFNAYPIPASDQLLIQTNERNYSVSVLDALGKVIPAEIHDGIIGTGHWPNGVYLLQFSCSGNYICSKRIIINHFLQN